MRLWEILKEDYNVNLESDIQNLLIGIKGVGINSIETSRLVSKLNAMGYTVDVESIIPLLAGSPNVTSATPEEVIMQSNDVQQDNADDSADKVSKLAQDATNI
jgi:hypothetical protein